MTQEMETIWRESSSLIIAAKDDQEKSKFEHNYKILILIRSDNTAIAHNHGVFPGGHFEKADESVDWLKYFEEFGVMQNSLKQLVLENISERPRLLMPQGNGCYDRFFKKSQIWAREISLRITALRETFEEVGLLLCRDKNEIGKMSEYGFIKNNFDKKHWQKLVQNNAGEFLNMCRNLKVIPDLWSLYEWSAWASPATIVKGSETLFFITFLNKMPDLLLQEREVKECMWHTPARALQSFEQGEIWFLPPQLYELSRLISMKSFHDLIKFAQQRSNKGLTLFLAVSYLCKDGMVSILPGDEFYLTEPRKANNFIEINATIKEFRQKAKRLHRIENFGTPNVKFLLNFDAPDGHLAPVGTLVIKNKL